MGYSCLLFQKYDLFHSVEKCSNTVQHLICFLFEGFPGEKMNFVIVVFTRFSKVHHFLGTVMVSAYVALTSVSDEVLSTLLT